MDPLAASEAQTPKWDRRDKDHALHPSHPTTELSEAVWPDSGAGDRKWRVNETREGKPEAACEHLPLIPIGREEAGERSSRPLSAGPVVFQSNTSGDEVHLGSVDPQITLPLVGSIKNGRAKAK